MVGALAAFLGLATLAVAIISWIKSSRSSYWEKYGITQVPTDGLISRYIRGDYNSRKSNSNVYSELKRQGKPFGGVTELGSPLLVVVDLELAREILIKNFDHFTNTFTVDMQTEDPHFSNVLFNMTDQRWKDMRSTLTPTFTTGRIRRMMHIFQSSSDKFATVLKSEGSKNSGMVDVRKYVLQLTLDIIASTSFGVDTDIFEQGENSIFMKMGSKVSTTFTGANILKFFVAMYFPMVAKLLKFRMTDKEADDFLTKLIKDCITHRQRTGEKRDDFLQLMLEARAENEHTGSRKIEITDDVIIAQALVFLLGGFDTVEVLLNCALYELALNPDVQDRLYKEVTEASAKEGGLTYEAINSCEYLNMIVSETLRKYSPSVEIRRTCTQPFKIPGSDFTMPKGTQAQFLPYSIHHDPEYYPDPEKFDPSRFTKEEVAKRHPMAYLPFGHGPRNCIGNRFALIESKVVIANTILKLKIEPCQKTDIPMRISKATLTTKPEGSIWLKVASRNA